MAACMRALGVGDAAARLPSALMAIGVLAGTAWIGAALVSPAAGATAAALLAISPFFLNNARRAMMEMPLAFWTTLAIMALVAGRRRRDGVWLLAPALAMAILVKSVLGLMPLAVALVAIVAHPAWRPLAREPRFWTAAAIGLALGASWPLHQWRAYGAAFIEQHFAREILGRSLAPSPPLSRLLGYPAMLLAQFEPVILLALPGAWWMARSWRSGARAAAAAVAVESAPGAGARPSTPAAASDPAPGLLLAWAIVPIAVAALSAAQSPRYVFPTFPALALLAGGWLVARWPRLSAWVSRWAVPALLLAGALVFWLAPGWLSRSVHDPFRDRASAIRARVPAAATIPYCGADYWRIANPLLWYDDRRLEASAASAADALERARRGAQVLMCDRARLGDLPPAAARASRLIETREAVLLDLTPAR
jgi:4-amino-4-deoxy-L-arabinose transferase-like glycosyltransferase